MALQVLWIQLQILTHFRIYGISRGSFMYFQ